jgi:hypothetical protein
VFENVAQNSLKNHYFSRKPIPQSDSSPIHLPTKLLVPCKSLPGAVKLALTSQSTMKAVLMDLRGLQSPPEALHLQLMAGQGAHALIAWWFVGAPLWTAKISGAINLLSAIV